MPDKKLPRLETLEDYEKFKREIEMEQAQKYHWDRQQWHWNAQRYYWAAIAIFALFTILKLWSK